MRNRIYRIQSIKQFQCPIKMPAKNVNIRQIKESASTKIALLSSFFDSCGTPFTYSKTSSGIKTNTVQKKYFYPHTMPERLWSIKLCSCQPNYSNENQDYYFFFKRRKFRTFSGKLYVVIRTCPCITP